MVSLFSGLSYAQTSGEADIGIDASQEAPEYDIFIKSASYSEETGKVTAIFSNPNKENYIVFAEFKDDTPS